MEGTLNLQEVRQRLAEMPAALRALTGTLSADALNYREAPDSWTAIEVLGHLADGELTDWIPRVRVILSDDSSDKRFTPFVREAGLPRYVNQPVAAALDDFDALRADSLKAFDAFNITPDDLPRQGIHPTFGSVTLEQLLATWVVHDYAHLAQISRILTRHYGERVGPWTAFFSLLKDRPR
jgi:DinB superfamily